MSNFKEQIDHGSCKVGRVLFCEQGCCHAGAHNSHLGDARATDMGKERGEVNVGELMRERFAADNPDTVVNIGFTTHAGTVTAADDWDEPAKHKRVNPSLAGAP